MAPRPRSRPAARRLPAGHHGLRREQIERSQEARLRAAMVRSVAEHGYPKTTIRGLAALAGVSPNAFYELYGSKEDCFLATHDAIAHVAIEHVANAHEAAGEDWRERLHAAFAAFIETVLAEPQSAYLAVVETHSVGAKALEHQQRALEQHERMMRHSFNLAPHGQHVSDTTIKAIVSGTRSIVYHHLSAGHPQRLRTLAQPLAEWALSYHTAVDATALEPTAVGTRAMGRGPSRDRRSPGNGARMSPRERLMRAVVALSAEKGYSALTVPAITSAAGVSNATFYEQFRNKHEAFIACYELASRLALGETLASYQAAASWPEAIRASLHALLNFIAAHPQFARLSLFEVLAAGPSAREHAMRRSDGFSALLDPGFGLSAEPPPRIVSALIVGGTWGVIQHHITHGATERLTELTPALSYVALAPFIGAAEAARVAGRAGEAPSR
jgi:AcrR family transcriptional regulator